MTKQFKIIVEKHSDGYIAYPLGVKDVKSAIEFHIETFGTEVFESETPVLEAFVAEAGISV